MPRFIKQKNIFLKTLRQTHAGSAIPLYQQQNKILDSDMYGCTLCYPLCKASVYLFLGTVNI